MEGRRDTMEEDCLLGRQEGGLETTRNFLGWGWGALGGSGQERGRDICCGCSLCLLTYSPRQHVGQVGNAGNFGLTMTAGRDETTLQIMITS